MNLKNPENIYYQILKEITGITVTNKHTAVGILSIINFI